MWDNLRQDIARLDRTGGHPGTVAVLEAALTDNGFQAVLFYRFARWFKVRRIPVVGLLLARMAQFLTGADISPSASIGPGFKVSHGGGLVIGGATRIGSGAHLHQNVTLGAASPQRIGQMPQIGADVFIGAGACVLGGVEVGDDVFIGAHALVTENVAARHRVLCAAGIRILSKDNDRQNAGQSPEPPDSSAPAPR